MAVQHGPNRPDSTVATAVSPTGAVSADAAAIDEAAEALLGVWDTAREKATNRLSGSQLRALLVVEQDEGINLGRLAGNLGMILSSASRLCDRLVAAGMLEREPGRADRREIALTLTPAGRALLDEVRAERRDQLSVVLSRMSPAARAALLAGLQAFTTATRPAEESTPARTA
ncbi:MarR family winged helix-turn-helix transcriptional regulator [Catenuloplanes atrovinosus]|uniref:DNA-binding MarR family transcriptional regulator n=1 Tax=Catenuloplanes atrovinosus TaxID=137266 RepID=A0AAE3YSI3_9ACTN|nr:MarR family transcriptional regulator [Catenuloplanes atrovinosus]MDR7278840.1 DNA-binding MarR family transcriptional regulator [Catenuloplanes atrovinosus]